MGNWDGSKPNNDGERELIDRAVKALEAELATKTCNKQIVSKLENAELARDSEVTCNNKQVTSKLVASEDAISRQAAIDALKNLEDLQGRNVFTKNGLYPWNVIAQLPSVTPKQKTGHWILRDDINGQYQCDKCGMFSGLSKFDVEEAGWKLSNFCSNCGTKMVVEPQEIDHKCHTCKHYTSGENDGSCGSYICKGYSNWESEEQA